MPRQFFWHARFDNGGNLSLEINVREAKSSAEKIMAIASGLKQGVESMESRGYIPYHARLMSSQDLAEEYGKTRQYWEKLLKEGKILYKETSAGRITTNLWVEGYLGNKETVDSYIKNVRDVLGQIKIAKKTHGAVTCPVCGKSRFEFFVNANNNTNGLCRACGFHVHTMN